MFKYDDTSRNFWFRSGPSVNLQEFNLVGVLMGLAVYNSIILDIRLPPIVYRKLLSPPVVPNNITESDVGVVKATLQDLYLVFPHLSKGLQNLLDYSGDVENDFAINFQISYEEFDIIVTHELIPGGNHIPVTNNNREEFVSRYVDFLLNQSIYKQFQAFYLGFHSVCASNSLILLRAEEIEFLVCGNPYFKISNLKKVTVYEGYDVNSPTIRNFWKSLESMDFKIQQKFLFFCTGSDRVPIGGLEEMKLKITKAFNEGMLPVSHTCFNQLMLPPYKTLAILKEKLLIAIQNAEGFGLQ